MRTRIRVPNLMTRVRSAAVLALTIALCGLATMPTSAQADGIILKWWGQGTTSIDTGGDVLLIDAFFVQTLGLGVLPEEAPRIRVELLTHAHADHFGATLDLLASNPDMFLAANSGLVRNLVALGLVAPERVIDWNKGGKLRPGTLTQLGRLVPPLTGTFPAIGDMAEIIMVPAEHSSSLQIPSIPGQVLNGGEAVGYIIRLKNGFTLYHAGDTYVFDEMRTIGERYRIDLALLPIGGNFTMDPVDAAFAATRLLRPRFVIPIHYAQGAAIGFSPALVGTPEEFKKALGKRNNIKVVVPGRGEAVLLTGAGPTANVGLMD